MSKKFLLRPVGGEPSGFLLSAGLAVLCVVFALSIALTLPSMQSFREIAWPSSLALLSAFFAAVTAIATAHALDDGEDSEL